MANKYELISKLAEETAKEVVKNGESWKQYLDTAARIYKYPFQEQLLIYAQRPDATACASIDIWNSRRFNCWVNKGAKGIALIDEDAPRPRLKYVFDISDIHKARRIGRTPYLWKMEPEHQETVIEHLEHIYGGTRQDKSFEERLLEIAQRITLDCYEEVWEDLQYLTEGSYLEGLDEYSGKIHLRETMQSSISYTLLARCGMDMENYEELLNFDYIHEFNTVPALSQLGSNITELCKPVLMEIGKAIRAYDREITKKRVANHNNLDYNALNRESVKAKSRTQLRMQMKVGKIAGMKKGARIMELTYQRNGDYYIPNIKIDEQPAEVLTKYGMMRKAYLQEHKKGLYSGLLLTGRLMSHLLEIQEAAEQRMEEITEQMAADEGVTEELKSKDQMKWIQFMNSIRHSAEEIVLTELIYN